MHAHRSTRPVARCLIAFSFAWTTHAPLLAEPAEPQAARDFVYREVPDDPFVFVPKSAQETAPSRVWQRGPFTSIQVNVDADGNDILNDAANEPSIAVDPTDRTRIAIGWRQFATITSNFRQAGYGWSNDGGASWTASVIDPANFRSDPLLESTSDGTFHYNSLFPQTSFACEDFRSTDGGQTWIGPVAAFGGDKAWMTIDRSGGVGDGNIYTNWSSGLGCCGADHFNRSTDDGASFEAPITAPGTPRWGTIDVGPDGRVWLGGATGAGLGVAWSSTLQDPLVAQAFDNSATVDIGGEVTVAAGPNPVGLLGQTWIAADPSDPTGDTVYMLASVDPPGSDPMDVHFVRSTDGGQTWSTALRVNDVATGWQWFGTMSVAPDGRIDVVWNDTRGDKTGFDSELYYARSTDGGQTFSTGMPLTPAFDPQVGYPNQDKIGDYYDMVSDAGGAHLAFSATFTGGQDVYYLHIPANVPIFSDGFEDGSSNAWTSVVGNTLPILK